MRFGSLNLRLTSLFSLIIMLVTLLLFTISYFLLSSSLLREQERELRSRLLEFWAMYQLDGAEFLEDEETMQGYVAGNKDYLIRMADSDNTTLFLYFRDEIDNALLQEMMPPEDGGIIRLVSGNRTMEIASLKLTDGNIFQIGVDSSGRIGAVNRYRNIFLVVALPLVFLSFIGGFVISERSLRPIQSLITAFRSIIDTGKLEARISPGGTKDELKELVVLFNLMLEKIDTLVQGMRDTLDNVAHDIRTPMARLRAKVEMLYGSAECEEEMRETLTDCLEDVQGILTMLNTLMDISEAETGVMQLNEEPGNLSVLLEDMIELYLYAVEERGLELRSEVPGGLEARFDANRIRQVVANLLDNAIKYSRKEGRITVKASRTADGWISVSVTDTGMGIPENEQPLIWNRLFRGDQSRSRKGLGLGLSLVKAIVEAHGGTVEVISREEKGSRFTLTLPSG